MRMQRSRRLLRLKGGVARIHACKDTSLRCAVATEEVLTWHTVLVVVAVRAIRAHAHTEEVLVRHKDQHPEAVHAGQRVLRQECAPRVIARKTVPQLLGRQRQVNLITECTDSWLRNLYLITEDMPVLHRFPK